MAPNPYETVGDDGSTAWVRDALLATAASLMIARECGKPEQAVLLNAAARDLAIVMDQLGPPRANPA